MSWIRLDEDYFDHPKLAEAGPLASWLNTKAIGYCNRYLTDGKVPRPIALTLVSWDDVSPLQSAYHSDAMTSTMVNGQLIERLVECGLWDEVDGGYQIHDYLDFQPSRAKVLSERAAERLKKEQWRKAKADRTGAVTDVSRDCPPGTPVVVPDVSPPCPALSVSVSVSDTSKRSEETLVPPSAPRPRFDFGAIYARYPRRKNMAKGKTKLESLVKTQADYDAVVRGLDRFLAEEQRKGTAPNFYPHFATWVNQRRWEDEDDPAEAPSTHRGAIPPREAVTEDETGCL